MKVTLTQHAVGQGGLMSGLLEIGDRRVHWLYDCGSNQVDARRRETAKIIKSGKIDLLFLSHLDSDHVNGIDELLAQTQVEEVVLPYLNEIDRLIVIANANAVGQLSGNLLNCITDIAAWFQSRGVTRITFIKPVDEDDEEIPPLDIPDGPSDKEAKEGKLAWWDSKPHEPSKSSSVVMVEPAQAITCIGSQHNYYWMLAPFAVRPSKKKYIQFKSDIDKLRQSHETTKELLSRCLKDENLLRSVQTAYGKVWSDHNLVSMALYSGPSRSGMHQNSDGCNIHSELWTSRRGLYRGFRCYSSGSRVSRPATIGWLKTGDMNLRIRYRREALRKHYRNLLDNVDVFCLPHHGAASSYHPDVLSYMPCLEFCLAASGPNGYGHPSKIVKDSVIASGIEFYKVSHKARKTFKWIHRFHRT